ncbi:MAG: hypothetical protein OHK0031_16970 [Anaerolineales bacterium]
MRLEDLHFCPRCAAPLTQAPRYGALRPVCPACGWVYFDDPKVAAGVLVRDKDGRVLLVQRSNPPFQGLWTLPAGFVNSGEDPAESARRECLEETNLEVVIDELLELRAGREHPKGADFILFYRAHVSGGILRAGDDAGAAGWFAPGELPPLAFQSTQIILKRAA